MKNYLVFGNENAESDTLLNDCYVNGSNIVASKPILVGRWGSGKTAILLHQGQALDRKLKSIDKKYTKIWYLREDSLDLAELRNLQKQSFENSHVFLKSLEAIWKAEILRVVSRQLSILREYYGNNGGKHWDYISSIHPKNNFFKSLWRSIPEVLDVIKGSSEHRREAAKGIQNNISEFFNSKLFDKVQECLEDIENHELQPLVIVEPIDSPQSPLDESSGLARSLITALLNVYRNSFEPTDDQRVIVKMSIPWHRYDVDKLEYPQKIHQHTGQVYWTIKGLREFINKRIEWEFARVHRTFSKKGNLDAWNLFFGETITNKHCEGKIKENSFLYVLRHTHHRARDLIRVSRMAVEYLVMKSDGIKSIDDILKSHDNPVISESVLRAAVRDYCKSTIDIRIAEAGRRFQKLRTCLQQLYGINVPFSRNDLERRIKNFHQQYCSNANVVERLIQFWESGIIGLEIYTSDIEKHESLKERLGSGLRFYKKDKRIKYRRWYLFEYNSKRNFQSAVQGFGNEQDVTVNFILHPMTFENLTPVVARDCPKGA